jgi:hypothetical protein
MSQSEWFTSYLKYKTLEDMLKVILFSAHHLGDDELNRMEKYNIMLISYESPNRIHKINGAFPSQ